MTLLVVALFDGAVRWRDERLKSPQIWYSPASHQLVADADRVHDEGLPSDVVFVGTSMVIRGVMVEEVEGALVSIDQAHNAALPAAQVTVVRRWLLEEMLPRLSSPRVVWGVSSLDFNGERLARTIDLYNAARATRPGVLGEIDRVLGDAFALSEYRDPLRDPTAWGTVLGWGEAPEPLTGARENADFLLASRNRTSGKRDSLKKEAARIRDEVLIDWAIGSDEASAFRSTLVELLEQGVEVVVILMPVPQVYVDQHPNGEDDFAEFLTYAAGVLEELGVPYIDYSRVYPEEAFYDVTHLTRESADLFSLALAEDLKGLGW